MIGGLPCAHRRLAAANGPAESRLSLEYLFAILSDLQEPEAYFGIDRSSVAETCSS